MAQTLQQKRALALVPKASGILSLMGSLFIIMDIVKSREKMGRTYSRILLVMSLFDLSTSIAQFMSTWPMPKDSGALYAVGSEMTCNFQGFFTQLGVGAPIYNCSLSFYYLVVIAFPLLNEARLRQAEWFLHGVPLVVAFSTAIMGIPLTLYNNSGLWCWVSSLPASCGNEPNGTGDCIRGDNAWIYRWAIYYAPVWACVLTITVNMAIVTYYVWSAERKQQSADSVAATASSITDTGDEEQDPALPKKPTDEQESPGNNKNAKKGLASQVFWQATYYVLAFYITWIFPTLLRLFQTLGKPVPYYIVLLMAILLPLQGFFNFLVYVRPRVVQYQLTSPGTGLWAAMLLAMRRTLSLTGSDSKTDRLRRSNSDELEDIEVLDPCYAMQVEREQRKVAKAKQAAAAAAAAATSGSIRQAPSQPNLQEYLLNKESNHTDRR